MAIKLLKEGEEGFGLLIEHDAGFISKEFTKECINEGLISEAISLDLTKPIYYFATLQKYGVENRNGRIYSGETLNRWNQALNQLIENHENYEQVRNVLDNNERNIRLFGNSENN